MKCFVGSLGALVALGLIVALHGAISCGVVLADAPATAPAAPGNAPTTAPTSSGDLMQPVAPGHFGDEHYRLVSQSDEIVSVLQDGLVVIVHRVPGESVAVRGYCEAGGMYEGRFVGGGLSHLLEHLVAGGSSVKRTEAQNKDLLQRIGNDSNAYTQQDYTVFFINTTRPHLAQAVDLLTGWMLGAKITVPEFNREHQVVQRELEMGKGQPDRQFDYLAQMNRYRVSPLRVPVIGYQSVIQALTRDDVAEYYKRAYVPNNIVLSIAGDFAPEEMLATVRQYLTEAKPGAAFDHNIAPEPPVDSPRTLVATFPQLGQARLELGFPSVDAHSDDMYALDLLATILGEGESSILTQDLRDQQDLVSAVDVEDDTPSYAVGTFAIDMQLDSAKIPDATKAALADLEKVKNDLLPTDRVARAKTQMRIARLRGMQTAEDIAASLATDYITTGDPHFSDLYVQRIESVTAEQMQAAARKYFDVNKLLTTALIPAEDAGGGGLASAVDLIRPSAPAASQPATPVVAEGETTDRSVLENGTVVLVRRLPSPLVSINMYCLGGVTAEDASNNGIGNLTMAMLTRGAADRSAREIAEYLDSTGAELHAACGNNTWSWTASCTVDDFENTLHLIGDVAGHPTFDPAQLDLMKQRMEAAIAGQDADWTNQAMRFFKSSFYGPVNSPYQFMPAGQVKNVQGFTADDLKKWYGEKIMAAPRVIAIFGDVDPAQAKALAAKYLADLPKVPTPPAAATPPADNTQPIATPGVTVDAVKVQPTQQALAGVVIGYRSNSLIGEPAEYTFTVAQTLCAGFSYPTGYIFETLRGRGLVYVAAADNVPGRLPQYSGAFMSYAGCDPKNVNEVVETILLNIARMQGTPADIQPSWFDRSKELIVTGDALETETPADQAQTAALDELLGLGWNYHAKFAEKIGAVTLPDVQNLCRTRLTHCVVAISTPSPELVNIPSGQRTYTSFPLVDLTPRGVQHDVQPTK